jgi:hypothetical protein
LKTEGQNWGQWTIKWLEKIITNGKISNKPRAVLNYFLNI